MDSKVILTAREEASKSISSSGINALDTDEKGYVKQNEVGYVKIQTNESNPLAIKKFKSEITTAQ